MSTDIRVSLLDILQVKGVEVSAVINGNVNEVINTLRDDDEPDLEYVKSMLEPLAVIKLPGIDYSRIFDVFDDQLSIRYTGNPSFIHQYVGWLDIHDIKYYFVP